MYPSDMIKKAPSHKKRVGIHTTLLDLVQAVNRVTEDERLVAATVAHLVDSGQARLTGTFQGRKVIIG